MTLTFPGWWKGGFSDRELVVQWALQPVLNLVEVFDINGAQVMDGITPRHPRLCTMLPEDYRSKLPIGRIYRGGGAADTGVLSDPASVQLAIIAETREDSWQLMEYCRMWLLSYADGGTVHAPDGSKILVDRVGELVGPQLVPELSPDTRMVPLTFQVVCRKPRGLPDYRKIRDSLS
ncbi:phage tail termination protein [Nocardia aurea]|uniref:phage tail termination protein n=1 Tax=Nocardia aurea TaxID=2144174 RepID=UPI0033B6F787